MDSTKHNYYKKLMELHAQGKIPAASLSEVEVAHDDWCGIHNSGYCDCDPDVRVRNEQRDNLRASASRSTTEKSLEETRPLKEPTDPCPHCGGKEFILWQAPRDLSKQAISCNGCGAVMSSTHPLDSEDRPMRPSLRHSVLCGVANCAAA